MNKQKTDSELISSATSTAFQSAWRAPSNIALIKYWGKHGNQQPCNPSLSITLKNATTTTVFRAEKKEANDKTDSVNLKYFFNNLRNNPFEARIAKHFAELTPEMPFLAEYNFHAESSNTFPYAAGIASSASSMAAVALFLTELEQQQKKTAYSEIEFHQRASGLARLFSGSASRSLYGGWVSWGATDAISGSSDYFASPLNKTIHPLFQNPGVAILIVSSSPKSISSTQGHRLMDGHPFAEARYKQARNNLLQLLEALDKGNFEDFANIAENEALTLHSLLMTSAPEGLLLKPESIRIIKAVRSFRKTTGTPVCFTLDAGPNIMLIYPREARKKVLAFIEESVIQHCENGKWIDDCMGSGPQKL